MKKNNNSSNNNKVYILIQHNGDYDVECRDIIAISPNFRKVSEYLRKLLKLASRKPEVEENEKWKFGTNEEGEVIWAEEKNLYNSFAFNDYEIIEYPINYFQY